MEMERARSNMPRETIRLPQRRVETLPKNKLSFKVRFIRKLLIQAALSFIVAFSVFAAFQSKTDFAVKVQNIAKSTVTYQINLKEIQSSGQRIAGYLHGTRRNCYSQEK